MNWQAAAQPSAAPAEAPHKFGLTDTWPARLAKSIYSAVTLPGDVYQGKAAVPQSANMPGGQSTENIGRVNDLAGLTTPITPRSALTLEKPIAAVAPTREALAEAVNQGFDTARNSGAEIAPAAFGRVSQDVKTELTKSGIDAELAPKTWNVLNKMEGATPGSTATIANVHTMRQMLGNIATDAVRQGANTEAKAARTAQQSLDSYLGSIPQADIVAGDPAQAAKILREAIGNSAAGFRSDRISEIGQIAKGNAEAANSGANVGNAIRQQTNAFLKSNDTRGFSPQEIAQAERVRRGTLPGNLSRVGGNLLGGGGGLGGIVSAVAGSTAAGPLGAALPLAGYTLKQFEKLSVQRQLAILEEMTRARSPLGQSVLGPNVRAAPNPYALGIQRQLPPAFFPGDQNR
jgi:hypothetical protein